MTDTDDTKAALAALATIKAMAAGPISPVTRLYLEAGTRFDTDDLQVFVRTLTQHAMRAVGDLGNQETWQLRRQIVEYLLIDLVRDGLTDRFRTLDTVPFLDEE